VRSEVQLLPGPLAPKSLPRLQLTAWSGVSCFGFQDRAVDLHCRLLATNPQPRSSVQRASPVPAAWWLGQAAGRSWSPFAVFPPAEPNQIRERRGRRLSDSIEAADKLVREQLPKCARATDALNSVALLEAALTQYLLPDEARALIDEYKSSLHNTLLVDLGVTGLSPVEDKKSGRLIGIRAQIDGLDDPVLVTLPRVRAASLAPDRERAAASNSPPPAKQR
jgi:hypothetical protein